MSVNKGYRFAFLTLALCGCVSSTTYRDRTPEPIRRKPVLVRVAGSGELVSLESRTTRLKLAGADNRDDEWVPLNDYLASNVAADVSLVRTYGFNRCSLGGGVLGLLGGGIGGGLLGGAVTAAWVDHDGDVDGIGALYVLGGTAAFALLGSLVGTVVGATLKEGDCIHEYEAEILTPRE